MNFKATICSECRKNIQLPTDVAAPACPYCGHIIRQEGAAPAATVNTLLGLARTAMTAGNNPEAVEYYNRVLESEPSNSEAWMGKGKAAGWQSSLVHIRLPEMLIAFNHAIATATDTRKEATIQEAVNEANRLAVTLYGMSRKHLLEYVSLQGSWANYLEQVAQLLNCLEEISKWNTKDRTTIENIIHLCKDNIEGISYRDAFDNNMPKAWTLTPQYEATLKSQLDAASERLRAIDPSYAPPTITKQKADACFVVTATMGDFDHPHVTFLRKFRDEWILQHWWGQAFVQWYYRVGPSAADFIAGSRRRRAISYHAIVRPLSWVARQLM